MASVRNDYFAQDYRNTNILELPPHIYTNDCINRELKNAQIALFDSLDHVTREIVCQTISFLKGGI